MDFSKKKKKKWTKKEYVFKQQTEGFNQQEEDIDKQDQELNYQRKDWTNTKYGFDHHSVWTNKHTGLQLFNKDSRCYKPQIGINMYTCQMLIHYGNWLLLFNKDD